MSAICGIYLLRNKVNGKVYVGQSINISKRISSHKGHHRRPSKSLIFLAIEKYGWDSFSAETLEECDTKDLDAKEIYWIDHFDSVRTGYNMLPGGQQGREITPDLLYRIGSYWRGKKLSPERVEQIRAASIGRTHSEETKQKMSEAHRGQVRSHETCQRLSESIKAYHASMTPEEKEIYADKRRGKPVSQEIRDQTSERFKGKPKSEETRRRMSESRKNESPEARASRSAALSKANKARWEKYRADKATGAPA